MNSLAPPPVPTPSETLPHIRKVYSRAARPAAPAPCSLHGVGRPGPSPFHDPDSCFTRLVAKCSYAMSTGTHELVAQANTSRHTKRAVIPT